MRRLFGAVAVLSLVSLPAAHAQINTAFNVARLISTINPAALAQPVGVSVGLSSVVDLGVNGNVVVGDVSLGSGALRVIAAHPLRFEAYGLGYGFPLFSRALTSAASLSIGTDVLVSYYGERHAKYTQYIGNGTSVNARLAVPVAMRLGSLQWLSVTPYLAPYAELGVSPMGYWSTDRGGACMALSGDANCRFTYSDHRSTRGIGTAVGVRLTAWRLALDAGYGDLPGSYHGIGHDPFTAAVSIRF